jgi:hypothetical protein
LESVYSLAASALIFAETDPEDGVVVVGAGDGGWEGNVTGVPNT